jgi:transaldolase
VSGAGGSPTERGRLHQLHEVHGQSPWIDNLTRPMVASGRLQALVDLGVRGVTSNPTIFTKAIEAGTDYDASFASLVTTRPVEDAYWELVIEDVGHALDVLAPVHAASRGADGFVSLEVAPSLAHDEGATVVAARWLRDRIPRSNLLVKIPATTEGVGAIRTMVGEGADINVTLIFGLDRYAEVMEAYVCGLEALPGDLSGVHGVASFFVSRVDTLVDRLLGDIATPEALALQGTVAVAQARVAYQLFGEKFSGPRWDALRARGACPQRPLWASTSTKNPAYDDLLYVDSLIGPETVNTMPDATLDTFADHGTPARTIDAAGAAEEARRTLDRVAAVGVDMEEVAVILENEGVASFLASYDELLERLVDKANAMSGTGR